MAKHPRSSRVHREPDGPDDAFIAAVESTTDWARKNSRLLIVSGIVLAALVAGAIYYINYQRTLEAQSATRFAEVQQTVASGNTQLAIRDLQTFVNRYSGTSAAEQARLLLADILLGEDQPQEALEALDDLPEEMDTGPGIAAARLQAAAYEALGQTNEAVDTYRRLARNARFDFQRREAWANAARVRLQSGDAEAAAGLYEQVLETFEENDPARGYYEMWLAEARAQAASEGTAAAPTRVDTAADTTAAG